MNTDGSVCHGWRHVRQCEKYRRWYNLFYFSLLWKRHELINWLLIAGYRSNSFLGPFTCANQALGAWTTTYWKTRDMTSCKIYCNTRSQMTMHVSMICLFSLCFSYMDVHTIDFTVTPRWCIDRFSWFSCERHCEPRALVLAFCPSPLSELCRKLMIMFLYI